MNPGQKCDTLMSNIKTMTVSPRAKHTYRRAALFFWYYMPHNDGGYLKPLFCERAGIGIHVQRLTIYSDLFVTTYRL